MLEQSWLILQNTRKQCERNKSNELNIKGPFKIQTAESRPAARDSSAAGICVPNKVEICAEAQSHRTLPCD